jgi:uncharacterized protein YecT (DUF1311 family)
MKTILIAVVVFAAGGAAAADTPSHGQQMCDPATQSAGAFHECYAANLAAANKALDETYRGLMAQKTFYVGSAAALRDVERAWIVYKDRECNYEFGTGSDENYWLARAGCEIRLTEQRVRELQGRPSCTGGDSVCYPHMR